MKAIALVLLSASIAFPPVVQAQGGQAGSDSTILRLGQEFVRRHDAVGLSIGVYVDGTRHFYNFGTTSQGRVDPPTRHTVHEIGSITKTFVALVLANAVQEGRVTLQDDVRRYLRGSYPNLEYAGQPIRLVDLANMTSLLPDWLPALPQGTEDLAPDSALRARIHYYGGLTSEDFLQALHSVTLDTVPGTRRAHSNA